MRAMIPGYQGHGNREGAVPLLAVIRRDGRHVGKAHEGRPVLENN